MSEIDGRYVKDGMSILVSGGGGILHAGGGLERRKGREAHGH